jgi:hypothetical protein
MAHQKEYSQNQNQNLWTSNTLLKILIFLLGCIFGIVQFQQTFILQDLQGRIVRIENHLLQTSASIHHNM